MIIQEFIFNPGELNTKIEEFINDYRIDNYKDLSIESASHPMVYKHNELLYSMVSFKEIDLYPTDYILNSIIENNCDLILVNDRTISTIYWKGKDIGTFYLSKSEFNFVDDHDTLKEVAIYADMIYNKYNDNYTNDGNCMDRFMRIIRGYISDYKYIIFKNNKMYKGYRELLNDEKSNSSCFSTIKHKFMEKVYDDYKCEGDNLTITGYSSKEEEYITFNCYDGHPCLVYLSKEDSIDLANNILKYFGGLNNDKRV